MATVPIANPASTRSSIQDGRTLTELRKRILVVDDEPGVLHALGRLFHVLDVEVETCSSPQRAMELFRDGSFDLVIADHRMPGMTGLELLRRMRSDSPKTPTILMTAFADPDAFNRAYERCGVFRYLTKPWDSGDLLVTVREALRAGDALSN